MYQDLDDDDSAVPDCCPLNNSSDGTAAGSNSDSAHRDRRQQRRRRQQRQQRDRTWRRRRRPCTLSKTTSLHSALSKEISVLISSKLTHQKSNRRLSPTEPSKGWRPPTVRRPGVEKTDSWRNVFSAHAFSRRSPDISTPSPLVLVYDRSRQTSNDVWITWLHS